MSLQCIHPEGISRPETFTHVVVSHGSRMVFIAGQVAEDGNGNLVGAGDMVAQSRQVFANIGRCLQVAGARPDQVTKLTIYVANYNRDCLPMIETGTNSGGNGKLVETAPRCAASTIAAVMRDRVSQSSSADWQQKRRPGAGHRRRPSSTLPR